MTHRLPTVERFALTAALLALTTLAPTSGAQSPTAQSPPVPQYKVDPYWPKQLPDNWLLSEVSGVAVDSRDHVWVLHRPEKFAPTDGPPPTSVCCKPAPPVVEFDPDGKVVQGWGGSDAYKWPE